MNKKQDDNPIRNTSGYFDFTAHDAIERANYIIERDRMHMTIDAIHTICELCGFQIEGRIVLRDKKSRRIWR